MPIKIRAITSDHVEDGEPLLVLSKKDYENLQNDPTGWGQSIGEISIGGDEPEPKKCSDPKCLGCYDGESVMALFGELFQ